MSGAGAITPAEKYLGPAAGAGGPFALLGVAGAPTPHAVIAGLERRLSQIAEHAEGRTPQADELRLALHAAAAQLLDPVVRGHLAEVWAPGDGPAAEDSAEGGQFAAPIGIPPRLALEGDAVLAMAMHGGWNAECLAQLCKMADARGLSSDDVAGALRTLSTPAARPAAVAPAPPRTFGPARPALGGGEHPDPVLPELDEEDEQHRRSVRRALIGAGIGVVVLTGLVAGVALVLRSANPGPAAGAPRPAPTASAPIAEDTFKPDRNRPPIQTPAPSPGMSPVQDADTVLQAIAAASAKLAKEPQRAAEAFAAAAHSAADSWTEWAPDSRAAVVDGLVGFLYAAGQTPAVAGVAARAMVEHAPSAADESPTAATVGRAVWSAGLASRMLRERDLPSEVATAARQALAAAELEPGTDARFDSGASAAVSALSRKLAKGSAPDVWKAWLRSADAASGGDAGVRAREILLGLEDVLLMGQEPTADRRAFDALELLTLAVPWRDGDDARRWLLRWFDSAAITSADLHAVTSTLALKSAAEGVDTTMVLGASADAHERGLLRTKYAQAWSLAGGAGRAEAIAKWLGVARERVKPPEPATPAPQVSGAENPSAVADLARAVTLSRLCESAAWAWSGDGGKSVALLDALDDPVKLALAQAAKIKTVDQSAPKSDGDWAVKFAAASNNLQARLDLIRNIDSSPAGAILGPVDAETLVAEALRGSPVAVKNAARDAVKRLGSSAAIVNALLEQAPSMQISPENSALVETVVRSVVPSPKRADWRPQIRRLLVERLIELLAGAGDLGVIDTLSQTMGESYQARLCSLTGTPPPGTPPPAQDSAAALRRAMQRDAERTPPSGKEPMPLRELLSRASGRSSVARGIVQEFAADQATAVELLGYTIAAQDPSRAAAVGKVLADLAAARRAATRLTEQIAATEEAALRLWIIRMEGPST